MRMAIVGLVVVSAFAAKCCHAVEVRLHCGRAVVADKPKELADVGLGYLLEIIRN